MSCRIVGHNVSLNNFDEWGWGRGNAPLPIKVTFTSVLPNFTYKYKFGGLTVKVYILSIVEKLCNPL